MIAVIVALIAIALFVNKYVKKHILDGVRYKASLSSRLVEIDEPFTFSTTIDNDKPLPLPYLKIYVRYPNELVVQGDNRSEFARGLTGEYDHQTTTFLLPHQRLTRSWQVSLGKRGRYIGRGARIVAGDFLGIDEVVQNIDDVLEMIAMPKTVDVSKALQVYGNYMGDISINRLIIEDPILTIGFREYTGREPMKSIHWPISLRSGKLIVRQYDHTTDYTVDLIINIESSDNAFIPIIADAERVFSLARGVMDVFEESRLPYTLYGNADKCLGPGGTPAFFSGQGRNHYYSVLEVLGCASRYRTMTGHELLDRVIDYNGTSTTAVFITPYITAEISERLEKMLLKYDRIIVVSCHERGLELLPKGVDVFVDRGAEE